MAPDERGGARGEVHRDLPDVATAPKLIVPEYVGWRWRNAATDRLSLFSHCDPALFGPLLCGGTWQKGLELGLLLRSFAYSGFHERLQRVHRLGWIDAPDFVDNSVHRCVDLAHERGLLRISSRGSTLFNTTSTAQFAKRCSQPNLGRIRRWNYHNFVPNRSPALPTSSGRGQRTAPPEEQKALDEISKLPPEAMFVLGQSGLKASEYLHQYKLDASRPK